MLTFPPIQFAGPFETFISADAIDDLAKRYCAGLDGAAHSPGHAQYPEVNAATNRAINDVKAALESGELRAFVNPAGTMEFFLIPAEYWQSVSTDSVLIGEVSSYPHNGLVPKGIRDKPILLRKDEWATWLSKRDGNASLVSQQDRSPSVKAGRPPADSEIYSKADEMKARGLTTYQISAQMRHELGFENVGTVEVRKMLRGRWKPSGRPKQKGA